MLQSMGSQRVGRNWATKLNEQEGWNQSERWGSIQAAGRHRCRKRVQIVESWHPTQQKATCVCVTWTLVETIYRKTKPSHTQEGYISALSASIRKGESWKSLTSVLTFKQTEKEQLKTNVSRREEIKRKTEKVAKQDKKQQRKPLKTRIWFSKINKIDKSETEEGEKTEVNNMQMRWHHLWFYG